MSGIRSRLVKLPEDMEYDLSKVEAQPSFGATLREVVRQIEERVGGKLSGDNITDILSRTLSESINTGTVRKWLNDGGKPKVWLVDDITEACKVPPKYFTRFYEV